MFQKKRWHDAQQLVEHQQTSTIKAEILQVQAVTPHNRAIYEAGKTMLIDSLKTGRDFCQFMITLNTGAISVYLALLTFLLPKNYSLSLLNGMLDTGPAILFLLSAIIFAIGFFPRVDSFSLDIISEIEQVWGSIIQWRKKLTTIGFGVFVTAAVYAIIMVMVNIGSK